MRWCTLFKCRDLKKITVETSFVCYSFILTLMPYRRNHERIFNLKTNESVTTYPLHIRTKCISSMNLLVLWNTYVHIRKLNMCLVVGIDLLSEFEKAFSLSFAHSSRPCRVKVDDVVVIVLFLFCCLASGSGSKSIFFLLRWMNEWMIQFNSIQCENECCKCVVPVIRHSICKSLSFTGQN